MTEQIVHGGCHCGAVRYRVAVTNPVVAHACNCSICLAHGFVGAIVPESTFTLLEGEGELTEYRFNTGVARHLFCKHCGVKAFYRPRSNPDGISINVHTLELPESMRIDVTPFDGQHWEANAHTLKHLSETS